MRNSNLLKWTTNNKTDKSGNRSWIHPPDALQKGHIVYLVKFLGNTEVDQPKGIEVVKEGIRKLKFSQQLRKSEGSKTPKVELTISVDGVAIQEPKTKRIFHQYPLHRISYCADDKGEKRFFSFIAKDSSESEQHSCFVFVSDKLAEEITLTIGQAFDLAYKRFLETAGKDLEVQRRMILLQQKVKKLESENSVLKQRIFDVIAYSGVDIEDYKRHRGITDIMAVESNDENNSHISDGEPLYSSPNADTSNSKKKRGSVNNGAIIGVIAPPPVPPRQGLTNNGGGGNGNIVSSDSINRIIPERQLIGDFDSNAPSVGTKLEGLLMDELEEDFNPRAFENNDQRRGDNTFLPVSTCLVNENTKRQQLLYDGTTTDNNVTAAAAAVPPPLLAPPPKASRDSNRRASPMKNGDSQKEDIFGSIAFDTAHPPMASRNINELETLNKNGNNRDPFGMGDFGMNANVTGDEPTQSDFENAIGLLDKKIMEMKDGFSRGLSFGNEDFSLESLDPLRK